jgi:geranylgeranyl transferase type-2 subunit alpha
MHGRLKVRTTEEQAERKRLEREKKLKMYQAAMAECFRRIQACQYDPVGLKITEDILNGNADLQTIWHYRKNTIIHLETTAAEQPDEDNAIKIQLYTNEMVLTEQCLKKSPKSYCAWFHRQWCLMRANERGYGQDEKSAGLSWKRELELCNLFLNADERNFHCWKHRYFVIENGKLSQEDELEFTYEKICANFSNYSAWHYRSKLIERLYNPEQISQEIFSKELALIENAIFTDPNDQAAWIYEKWFLLEHQRSIRLDNEQIEKHLANVLELSELEGGRNKWCLLRAVELMCLVDFERHRALVFEYLERLAAEIDVFRANFYHDLKRSIEKKYLKD